MDTEMKSFWGPIGATMLVFLNAALADNLDE
jgi:hypothetical protein